VIKEQKEKVAFLFFPKFALEKFGELAEVSYLCAPT
jgi:hypothetical protein